jgi:hypothetical protein
VGELKDEYVVARCQLEKEGERATARGHHQSWSEEMAEAGEREREA